MSRRRSQPTGRYPRRPRTWTDGRVGVRAWPSCSRTCPHRQDRGRPLWGRSASPTSSGDGRRYSRITVLRRVSYLRSQAMTAQSATPVSAGDGVLVVPGGDPAPLFGRAELPLDDVAAGVHGLAEAGRPGPVGASLLTAGDLIGIILADPELRLGTARAEMRRQ